jgi:hypothetical protein
MIKSKKKDDKDGTCTTFERDRKVGEKTEGKKPLTRH